MSHRTSTQISSDMDKYAMEAGIKISRYTNPIRQSDYESRPDKEISQSNPPPSRKPTRTRQKMIVDAPVVTVRQPGTDIIPPVSGSNIPSSSPAEEVIPPSKPQHSPRKSALKKTTPSTTTLTRDNSTRHVGFSSDDDVSMIPSRRDLILDPSLHTASLQTISSPTKRPSSSHKELQKQASKDKPSTVPITEISKEPTPTPTPASTPTPTPTPPTTAVPPPLFQPTPDGKLSSNQQTTSPDNDPSTQTEEYPLQQREEKAAEFFSLIENKVSPQLLQAQKQRDDTARTLHELEKLIDSIRLLHAAYIANNSKKQTVETKVDIGCKIFAEGKFVNDNKIIIDLGLGVYTELSFLDAISHLEERCALYKKRLDRLSDECCLWSARVKALHEAIGVLLKVTD